MAFHAFIILTILSVAGSVLWCDPKRLSNQAFALVALIAATWVGLLWILLAADVENPVPLIRSVAVFVAFVPWAVWWNGQTIMRRNIRWRDAFVRGAPLLLAAALLAVVALSNWYIHPEPIDGWAPLGGGYYVFHALFGSISIVLCVHGVRQIVNLPVNQQRDFRLFFIGGAWGCLIATTVVCVFRFFDLPHLGYVSPGLAFLIFAGIGWSIAFRRGPGAQHRHLAVLRRLVVLLAVSSATLLVIGAAKTRLPVELSVILAVIGGGLGILALDRLLRRLQNHLTGHTEEEAAAQLRRLAVDVHAMSGRERSGDLAGILADVLACEPVALYWGEGKAGELTLISVHPAEAPVPATLAKDNEFAADSITHGEAWQLTESAVPLPAWAVDFQIGIPVLEGPAVQLLILLGESDRTLGYTTAEIAALQSLAAACNHSLAMRKMMEQQAGQKQLALTGKLAAGIAHNIRNPLAVVRASLEADPALPGAQARELHRAAADEVKRIQSTVDSLSALARGERFALERHDLALLIDRVLAAQAPYPAECGARGEAQLKPGVCFGMVEPHQLAIALTNLVRNAAEEIAKEPAGGVIAISASHTADAMVAIRVADTGRGLPRHIVEAVFTRELFAKTTKAEGRTTRRTGYGIGLHSTMLIITIGHGGRFEYHNGAFHLNVPDADPAPSMPSRKQHLDNPALLRALDGDDA